MLRLRQLRPASNSWVMLSDTDGFVPLPGEHVIYTSPPRTSLSIQTPSHLYPGSQPLSISSAAGCIHLTNQRVSSDPSSPFGKHPPNADASIGALFTDVTDASSDLFLRSYTEPSRHPRQCPFLRTQRLERRGPTGSGGRNPGHTHRSGTEDDVQGRWCL